MSEEIRANEATLELFNAVIEQREVAKEVSEPDTVDQSNTDTQDALRRLLVEYNVLVLPEAQHALKTIETYVERTQLNTKQLNSTFYRRWKDVLEKTRLELFIDQVLHYASTYGTDFTGTAYIPADSLEIKIDTPTEDMKLTAIGAIAPQLAVSKCRTLLGGGTALKQRTIENCLEVLKWAKVEISIDETKNKETRALLIEELIRKDRRIEGCAPEELLRAAVALASKQLLLIKSAEVIESISSSSIDISHVFQQYGVSKLAPIFNRFKPLFIAFKRANANNKQVVNRISKLSKSLHKPLVQNPLNMVTHRRIEPSEIHWLDNATVPALIRALNACEFAKYKPTVSLYRIRNGKRYLVNRASPPDNTEKASQPHNTEKASQPDNTEKASQPDTSEKASQPDTSERASPPDNVETVLANSKLILGKIAERLGQKIRGKTVYIPQNIEYGLPTSEKQMIGTIPSGTIITFNPLEKVAVGIYWKSEYGCTDLDLSASSLTGARVSWDTDYKNESIVYSGDVTSPGTHGATEYIMTQGKPPAKEDWFQIWVNEFHGDENYGYDIIIGTGDDVDWQYMMNPKNRLLSAHYDASQVGTAIGSIILNQKFSKFVLSPSGGSQRSVQSRMPAEFETCIELALRDQVNHALTLNKLIEMLGAVITSDPETQGIDYDLSLEKINRDLLNLFIE